MVNVKTCLLGDGFVGKTSLKKSFIGLPFEEKYQETIGAAFSIKDHQYRTENNEFQIQYLIYDLAGQPRYFSVRTQYMLGAHAAICVYDITNRESYDNVMLWIDEFKKVIAEDVPIVIVANKIDLKAEETELGSITITKAEGEKLFILVKEKYGNLENNNIFFIETSAKDNINVEEAFNLLSAFIFQQWKHKKTTS